MADTNIEWAGKVWNPVVGCSLKSPGCTNCYAMPMAARLEHMGMERYSGLTKPSAAGAVWTGEIRLVPEALRHPMSWKRPQDIFVNSMSDLFHEDLPFEAIDRVLGIIALCPQHTMKILTKRPDRAAEYLASVTLEKLAIAVPSPSNLPMSTHEMRLRLTGQGGDGAARPAWPLANVLIGASIEDQRRADERLAPMAALAAAGWRTWVSYEPALGLVDWIGWEFLTWLVSGGESGPRARPSHPDWHSTARDFCSAHGIPFFFKQWGEWAPGDAFGVTEDRPITDRYGNVPDWMARYTICGDDRADRLTAYSFTEYATDLVYRVGRKRAGRLLDGIEHNGFPTS